MKAQENLQHDMGDRVAWDRGWPPRALPRLAEAAGARFTQTISRNKIRQRKTVSVSVSYMFTHMITCAFTTPRAGGRGL